MKKIFTALVALFTLSAGFLYADQGVLHPASSLITHVMMLVFMSALAFGISTATLVSQSIGAGKDELASRYAWQSVRLAVYFMAVFGLLIAIFPEPVLRIFLPDEPGQADYLKAAVIELAIPSMRVTAGLLSPLAAAGLILTQALYGAGHTKFIMYVELILHFSCLVPLAWLLAIVFDLGLAGCWWASVVYAILLTTATSYKFMKADWVHHKL